jgi:hypothetical protein
VVTVTFFTKKLIFHALSRNIFEKINKIYVAVTGDRRGTYRVLMGKPGEKTTWKTLA